MQIAGPEWDPPHVSVLVAVKNEERVVGRLLGALTQLDYPRENLEIILAEDGSKDKTLQICKEYAAKFPWVRVYHRDNSNGKADALNFAFHRSTGEVIATFDADDVPEPQCVRKALRYFDRPEVGAVYGSHEPLNFNQSWISRLLSCELFLFGLVNQAKSALGLFVSFSGSNLYLRRSALEQVGLWDENSLVEDVELAVRFSRARIVTILAPINAGSETPATLRSLVRQRVRWSGGNFQTGAKHWDAWRQMPWLQAFDMGVLTLSPALGLLLLGDWTLMGLGVLRIGVSSPLILPLITATTALSIPLMGAAVAMVLTQVTSRRWSYLKLILEAYPYAVVIALANTMGMFLVTAGFRKRIWYKTDKTGFTDTALTEWS